MSRDIFDSDAAEDDRRIGGDSRRAGERVAVSRWVVSHSIPDAAVKFESSMLYSSRMKPPSEIDGVTVSVVPASA